MTIGDLGVLSNLATALGLYADGDPNPEWFGHPDEYLATMLAEKPQRDALIAFVDEVLGDEDRQTDAGGTVWLPIVSLSAPDPLLDIAVTIDDTVSDDYVAVGLGIAVRTTGPTSRTTLQIPLFRPAKSGRTVASPFLLGSVGGRIRIGTSITVDASAPVPGEARIGSIGLELDLPSHPADDDPSFALTLGGLQLPGADEPRDLTISAEGADELDDAVLDLVLALVRAQAESAAGTPLEAVAGLLGLVAGDPLPDFPIADLADSGVSALATWLHALLTVPAQRTAWIGYVATLLGVAADGDEVEIDLGLATARLGLQVDTGPGGNALIRPTVRVSVSSGDNRIEARAELCRIDLVGGSAVALPSLGVWAAVGAAGAGHRVLDVAGPPVARADTLRVGFGMDAERRLTFVLAADQVRLGTRDYPTLDLTSPDAVMDAAGNALEDVAADLLGHLGDSLAPARVLLGLEVPPGSAGVVPVSLAALLTDPVAAVTTYWKALVRDHRAAVAPALEVLRDALADATGAATAVTGDGTLASPWTVALIGPLALQVWSAGDRLVLDVALRTSVDTLGQQCTVIETRVAATLADIDLERRSASLLTGVEARLTGRENGVLPSRARLELFPGVALQATYAGIRLAWSADNGLVAEADFPDLTLLLDGDEIPVALPEIGPDGTVTLPPEGWDALQELIGQLSRLLPDTITDLTDLLGWSGLSETASGAQLAVLRLADLVDDPATALGEWLAQLTLSELAPRALTVLADLLSAAGPASGRLVGTGHPDDPFRLDLQPGVPELVAWFPPAGLLPRVVNAPESLRNWRPGMPGLTPAELAGALEAEAAVAADVADLIAGRDLVAGLTQLTARWALGDGRIVPPAGPVPGVTVSKLDVASGQLLSNLDLEDELGRVPTTTVYVAVGSDAGAVWPDSPVDRRVDLTPPGLAPSMFTAPAPQGGDWFVALGVRAACRLATGDDDGTAGQAARLQVVLDALAPLGNDLVVVGVAGAGHATRLAAQAQAAVADVVTLGTPLAPISLTALTTQPTADTLRLVHRLLPPEPAGPVPDDEPPDGDLPLARSLVSALLELAPLADPGSELRPPLTAFPAPRAGLSVTALFGVVSEAQVRRALTAAVASGLAHRARIRAATPLPPATGARGGLRFAVPATPTGTLEVSGHGLLTLLGLDVATGPVTTRELRIEVAVGDRLGWLTSTPELELRRVTADVVIPFDGSPGTARVTLHDARVGSQSWERLDLGAGPGAVPLLPEARVLLSAAVQRLTADAAGTASVALAHLLEELGLIAAGAAAFDAFDQLIHDPGGLVRTRLVAGGPTVQAAIAELLGPVAAAIDLTADRIRVQAGAPDAGRFGWAGDVTVAPTGISGMVSFGTAGPAGPAGALLLALDLAPFTARLHWHQPGGGTDTVELWPAPDAAAIARAVATAAPSLGGHVALELMRRADPTARPVIDAALDALGLLAGAASDADRSLRPLAGLLGDPAGWLRSADSLASSPAKIQGLLDAVRPLLGIAGGPGTAWQVADGVRLGVTADGDAARIELTVDADGWTAPAGGTERLGTGLAATLTVRPTGPPTLGVDVFVGLPDADPGREAVHARLDSSGLAVYLRPATGSDIPLVPFSGLGGLAVAAKALPFLLDKLAEVPGTVGDAVAGVGDALALRTTTAPRHFDEARLTAWAADPVAALAGAVPTIVSTGLATLAPLLDDLVPATVSIVGSSTGLTATVGAATLTWDPATGRVSLSGTDLAVPGVDLLSFTVAISAAGLDELSVTVGPAEIQADTAVLRPFVTVAGGNAPIGGRRVLVGLAVDDTHRFAARWLIDTHAFALVASDGPLSLPVDDPGLAALRAVEVVADLVVAVAMATDAVGELLDTAVFDSTVRKLLRGVVLEDVANPTALIDGLFDLDTLPGRIQKLFTNIAAANISFTVDGQLEIALAEVDDVIGLKAGLVTRWPIVEDDVSLWLENDDSWIEDNPAGPGGLFVGFLDTSAGLEFKPSLGIYGVGLRIGRQSGPLLDAGLTLESVALHAFAELDLSGARAGGAQLQLTNLAISAGGASGGNGIAAGIMRDTGSHPPQPAFSPALAIQKHGTDPVSVTLRAGDGDGPWWVAIQKGFGPLYVEQVGLGVVMPQRRVERVSVLIDGSVSLFGLTCAVDDLQITYLVSKDDFFNPAAWDIDLAGLAVSANMAGLTIAGGLLKQQSAAGIEYLGMLLARFGVYGITIYGGYGEGDDNGQKFVAFFAVGSVVGPIGGPPAFFLTGIGGGFGINRELVVPTDLSRFGDYPLIKALDVAAKPGNPMEELRALGTYFPMKRGSFWFAAGLSFNSFALVDGIAVVAIEVGDGLDINLLGLARMALPRPQVALVSIEIALLVRFSTSEGVLWVQGQLTDNSWLLYPDIRLTGGFAFVIWFKGEYRGQFVLTLGGFHPDFKKPGYPVVPRLGLRWGIGDTIVIKAGTYFALTSEALMAGGDFEASASFGPAWAKVAFGAHGIIYFDPFRYSVMAYARIDAGVTIDLWFFGEVTISVHLGAKIEVEGPDFHGRATFEVGPIELTVEFGSSEQTRKELLGASAFVDKYLEPTSSGAATLSIITTFGTQPSGGGKPTPDGTPDRPFVVVCEFGLIVTSTVPIRQVNPAAGLPADHPPTRTLGVAPMGTASVTPTLQQSWQRNGAVLPFPFRSGARPFGAFPVGVWGPPQDDNNRKVPAGEVIGALCEVTQDATAAISPGGPEIPYYQVEIGKRLPLPFKRRASQVNQLRADAAALAGVVTQPVTVDGAFAMAKTSLATTASPTALAALRGERQAPPRAGTLGEGLDTDAIPVIPDIQARPVPAEVDSFVDPPIAVGVLRGATTVVDTVARPTTSVKDAGRLWRTAAPTLATVDSDRSRSIAATLTLVDAIATPTKGDRVITRGRFDSAANRRDAGSVIATGAVPTTAMGLGPGAAVARTGSDATTRLRNFSGAMTAGRRTRAGDPGAVLNPGDIAVLLMPNARRDVGTGQRPSLAVVGAPARVIAFAAGGEALADGVAGGPGNAAAAVPSGTERIVVIGLGAEEPHVAGLDGWHSGSQLPYLGWSSAIGRGCTVQSVGQRITDHSERLDAGWISGAELARGLATVVTRFSGPVNTVAVVLDDPTAFGNDVDGRRLVLGLDGAERVRGSDGRERPPVLMSAESRSFLAYDVRPTGVGPVTVTIATEEGWSLVAVMGSADTGSEATLALLDVRGLDAALRPLSPGTTGTSRIGWLGETRPTTRRRTR